MRTLSYSRDSNRCSSPASQRVRACSASPDVERDSKWILANPSKGASRLGLRTTSLLFPKHSATDVSANLRPCLSLARCRRPPICQRQASSTSLRALPWTNPASGNGWERLAKKRCVGLWAVYDKCLRERIWACSLPRPLLFSLCARTRPTRGRKRNNRVFGGCRSSLYFDHGRRRHRLRRGPRGPASEGDVVRTRLTISGTDGKAG